MPATDDVLMTTPRCPSASAGAVSAIAAAAIRIRLKVPVRLTAITFWKLARPCGAPSLLTVRSAHPIPAQLTATRSGRPDVAAAVTAAATDSSSVTSVLAKCPPMSAATSLPRSSLRSAMTTCTPARASSRAVASPRPLAAPVTIAEVPFSSMARSILRLAARRAVRTLHGGDEGLASGRLDQFVWPDARQFGRLVAVRIGLEGEPVREGGLQVAEPGGVRVVVREERPPDQLRVPGLQHPQHEHAHSGHVGDAVHAHLAWRGGH